MSDETYGFGPREGRLAEELANTICNFAHTHDISLPELMGLYRIAEMLLLQTMVREVTDGDEPEIPIE